MAQKVNQMTLNYMSLDRDPAPDVHYFVSLWSEVPVKRRNTFVPESYINQVIALAMWNWARSPYFEQLVAKTDVLDFVHRYDPAITQVAISRFLQTYLTYKVGKRQRIPTGTGWRWSYMFMHKEEIIIAAEQNFRLTFLGRGEDFDLEPLTALQNCQTILAAIRT